MSKSTSNTRGKILDRALEMFNERGIEYVGLRELAADLEMRVSNITYYFPTKDDLVFEISAELSKTNSLIFATQEKMTMTVFLLTMKKVFRNQIRFKCLMLSFVHLMKQNPKIAAAYKETQKTRHATIQTNLQTLKEDGYLKIEDESDMHFLGSTLALISRFWISETVISFRNENEQKQIDHFLLLITKLLEPYCSAKGKREIQMFLSDMS
jgi:AcrR family transcriptional regulator